MLGNDYLYAFVKGFVITQAVEIPIVCYLIAQHFHCTKKNVPLCRIISAAFFSNMATLPYLWFFFPEFLSFPIAVAAGEITALVAEAIMYYTLLKSTMRSAFITSLTANCCSVLVGLFFMPQA